MKRLTLFLATVLVVVAARAETDEDPAGAGGWYAGAAGAMVLPQGGSRLRRLGGAAFRVGRYFGENLAVEGAAAWLEDQAGLSAQALWHWQGWTLYNSLFGYSRFDPFFTFGVKGWVGCSPGQVGPKAGIGACYHLTDAWALRADAGATLGLETQVEMLYGLSAGVQYSF